MAVQFKDLESGIRHVSVDGRLDSVGSDEISTQFAVLVAGAAKRVVIDLTLVSFLSSIGIRLIVQNAKGLQSRGGRVAIYVGNNEQVTKTLELTGISTLIPIFADLGQANQAVLA